MRITRYRPRTLRRAATAALFGLLLATGVLTAATASGSATSAGGITTYSGVLDGVGYRVQVPGQWNGTLILWSHGDYSGYVPTLDQISLAGQPATAQWLLSRGYALAASNYSTPDGWVVQQALTDQIALLNWYDKNVGQPRQTITAGNSMGGLIAVLLAERNPGQFSAVLSECGAVAGGPELFNSTLDLQFALKTLLAPDSGLELVHITNPQRRQFHRHQYDPGRRDHHGRACPACARQRAGRRAGLVPGGAATSGHHR